jgi:hypothetical protein
MGHGDPYPCVRADTYRQLRSVELEKQQQGRIGIHNAGLHRNDRASGIHIIFQNITGLLPQMMVL